jgi:glycosyltransferase involved in cell wall biosynthesis
LRNPQKPLAGNPADQPVVIYLVSEDWYFWSHRRNLARAARDNGWKVVVATRVTSHDRHIEQEGFRCEPVEVHRGSRSPFDDALYIMRVVRLYRRYRPKIVHHVGIKPILYGSIAARLVGVPSVVNAVAGLGYLFISQSRSVRLIRAVVVAALRYVLARAGMMVVVQNADDRAVFASAIVDEKQVVTIPGAGVDVDHFTPQPERPGEVVVAQVGRLLWDKGIATLVEAAAILHAWGAPVRVVAVGDTDAANPASVDPAVLDEWRREGHVEFWGFREDMRAVWEEAHIAVLPSLREGMPKSLLEAAACGRPLIATAVPGCRELVRDGENGLLVPANDSLALADAIHRLVIDPGKRQEMGTAARRIVESGFADRIIIGRTLALYDALEASAARQDLYS